MKESLKLFERLIELGEISIENFYTTTVTEYDIKFQGKYDPVIIRHYTELGWEFKLDDGWTNAEKLLWTSSSERKKQITVKLNFG